MKQIDISNYKKCLNCDHSYDDDEALYCELSKCNYKEIDIDVMMRERSEIDTTKCRG